MAPGLEQNEIVVLEGRHLSERLHRAVAFGFLIVRADQSCLVGHTGLFEGPSHTQVADQAAPKGGTQRKALTLIMETLRVFVVARRVGLAAATRFRWRSCFVFIVAAHPCHAPWQRAFVAALRCKIEEVVGADKNVEAARV